MVIDILPQSDCLLVSISLVTSADHCKGQEQLYARDGLHQPIRYNSKIFLNFLKQLSTDVSLDA